MMKGINVFNSESLKKFMNETKCDTGDGHWTPCRPIGEEGIIHRIKCAIEVFRGKADIVRWRNQ